MLDTTYSSEPGHLPPNHLPFQDGPPPLEPVSLVEKKYSDEEIKGDEPMSWKTLFAILALASTYVSTNIGGFFSGVVILYTSNDFETDMNQFQWLQIIPDLLFACSAPIVGYLTDLYGRRVAIVIGMSMLCIGTIVMAASPGFVPTLVGQAVSGSGGAIAGLSATAAIAELVPVRKRGLFLALITLLTLPFVPSVLYAELISKYVTWRWCWGVVVIWSATSFIALGATYYRLELVRPGEATRRTTLQQIDYLGILLLIVGSVLLIIGLESGTGLGWTSPFVLGSLIIGVVLLMLLSLWEWKGAKAPLIPPRLFHGQRAVALSFAIVFVGGMYFAAADRLGPYIFTSTFAASPVQVGVMALGPSFGIMIGATGFNFLLSVSRGAARELLTVASVLMAGFGGALAASTTDTLTRYLIFSSLAGIGVGGLLEPTTTLATFACPQDLIGTVVSLSAFIRTVGGTVGYVVFSSIAWGKGTSTVPQTIGAYAHKAGLNEAEAYNFGSQFYEQTRKAGPGASPSTFQFSLPGVTPEIVQAGALGAQQAFSTVWDTMYYAQIPFGIIVVLLCISLPNIRKLVTDQVVVRSR